MKADGLHHLLYPMITVLLTSSDDKKQNVMAANWVMPVSFDPFLIAVAVGKKRFTHKLISKTKEFCISIPDESLAEKIAFCGTWSGKNSEKFKEAGLTPIKAEKVASPLIKECMANIECRVINQLGVGDHTLFIGEVLAVHQEEKEEKMGKRKKLFYNGEMKFLGI